MSLLRDVKRFPIGWRVWMRLLVLVNIVAPLFLINHLEARVALGAGILAALVIVPMHRRLGWVRLLGIGHFQWLVLVPWLVSRYLTTAPTGVLAGWMLAIILIDTVSVAIDVVDVGRYLAGERTPVVGRKG